MTDFSQYTDQQLAEAITFYRRQRNGSMGLNEAAHVKAKNFVRLAEEEQAHRLDKAEQIDELKKSTVKEEVEQIDEISASTLQSYVGKARDSKKAEMKNRTAAKNDMKKYGMAMDKKAHDDAARKVVNRGTGISVANKKLNTYPTDKAKAKVMAREEVELDEETKYIVKGKSPFYKQDHFINTHETPKAQLIKKNIKHATRMDLETAKKVAKDWESHPNKYKTEVVPVNEAFEQIDEISNELKAKYLDKAVQQRYDRFVAPRNTSAPKLKGAAKKAADAAREKANAKDARRGEIIDKTAEKLTGKPHYHKMSTMTTPAVHGNADAWWKGKKYSKEEVELDESNDLRITKIYNKWPKKATYAVHTPDRKYFKEFDSMEAAKAHHDEKSMKKESVYEEKSKATHGVEKRVIHGNKIVSSEIVHSTDNFKDASDKIKSMAASHNFTYHKPTLSFVKRDKTDPNIHTSLRVVGM